jgi:glycosyltransferase involved in cell wall biosynthesis
MSRSAKPTLLIISQVYPPDPTSVGQHMHDAAKGLAKHGYDVRVLTSARGYDNPKVKYPPRETMDDVVVIRLPLSSLGKKSIFHRLAGQAMFLLQAIIRGVFTPRLRCILVSTSPPMASVAALAVRLVRRVPIKYWVMDLNPDQMIELGRMREDALAARAFNFLNRRILRAATDVVALDRFMAERLLKKLDVRDKLTIQPPWPHSEHLEPVEHDENPFRAEHGLDGKFVVMYSGNHGFSTPVKTVLDAAVRMQDRNELAFMFIGGGVGKRDVEQTIAEHHPRNVYNLPYQPLERVRYSLSAADVHLVSVGNDVVGVVHPCKVYGAMALGRPILLLGPDPCHVSDLMRDERIGWHIEHGDVDGAIALIDEIRRTPPEELRQMGQRAADIIKRRFDQNEMIDEFCKVVLRGLPPAATSNG